jgi:hypothetical protein
MVVKQCTHTTLVFGYDCGLFISMFMECIASQHKLGFNQPFDETHMPHLRRRHIAKATMYAVPPGQFAPIPEGNLGYEKQQKQILAAKATDAEREIGMAGPADGPKGKKVIVPKSAVQKRESARLAAAAGPADVGTWGVHKSQKGVSTRLVEVKKERESGRSN